MNEPIQPDSDRTVSLPPTPADETAQGRTESSHDPSATLGYEAPPGATTDDLAERGPDADGSAAVRKPRRDLPSVPGYEISGVLGRGGMGVVYRARQVRLNRPVALKMVLAGAHAGPDQLARFDQEARAVARLAHPNIVQIYEIGEHDGLPYFSLEFVDGGTLAKHIDGKPRPPREAAEVLLALAKAMGFAHQHHIVHRDLKPANVLLGVGQAASLSVEGGAKDKQGCLSYVPKVTDFGLAKAVEEGGTVQTASGTVMGTPAYMPPEQARGDLKEIGPLCDLYALGAILYDLLTGRPPFQGASMLETLDQVRNREPVPPRLLQPTVPIDLETVCLKCLQKEPEKRYADCGALAEDLRRFLAGEPIVARPVSAPERLWRWCKRNPRVALPSAAALLLLVGLTAGSIWVAWQMSIKNAEIESKKTEAEEAAALAQRNEAEAEAQRKIASAEAQVAAQQAGVALTTVQAIVTKSRMLDEVPGSQEFKKDLLLTALAGAKQVIERAEKATDTHIGPTIMAAHQQMGTVHKALGNSEEALKEYRKVHEIARGRVALQQGSDASRKNLAFALHRLGDMDKELKRDMKSALQHYKEALALLEAIDKNPKANQEGKGLEPKPAVLEYLAELNTIVGATHQRLGELAAADPYFHKGLEVRRQQLKAAPKSPVARRDVARSLLAAADTSFRLNEPGKAEASFSESLSFLEGLSRDYPKSVAVKLELGRACGLFGEFYRLSGDPAKARPLIERSLALAQELTRADPQHLDYNWDLSHAYYRLGLVALMEKDPSGALVQFQQCLAVREKLATRDRANDRRQMEYMLPLAHCGKHAEAAAIAAKLLAGKQDAELLLAVARGYAWCGEAAGIEPGLRARYRREAIQAIEKAIELGFRDPVYLSAETDLAPLRDDPAFDRMVKSLRGAGRPGTSQ